jgi:hypothetical protein
LLVSIRKWAARAYKAPMQDHDDLPDELRDLAERLRREATRPTATELDQLKLRAMRSARSPVHGRKGSFMKTRLATLVTILALTIGAGGTFAIAGGGTGDAGTAAKPQYKPPQCPKPPPKKPPPNCP